MTTEAVLDVLRRSPRQARFVPELRAALRPVSPSALEAALADLESAGQVIVRDHSFSDPHVEGTDLRLVGLVASAQPGDDPQATAITNIERTWDDWLTSYLANHRCT